jgi:hypothetical protein
LSERPFDATAAADDGDDDDAAAAAAVCYICRPINDDGKLIHVPIMHLVHASSLNIVEDRCRLMNACMSAARYMVALAGLM